MLRKPLWGVNCASSTSTSFFWEANYTYQTPNLFHKLLVGVNYICTTCNSLHGFLCDAKCVSKPSTRLHKPLWDANCVCRASTSLRAVGLQTPATKHLLTFTSLCIFLTALAEPLLACTSLCRKLTGPNKALTGFTFCRELIAFEEPLAVFTTL